VKQTYFNPNNSILTIIAEAKAGARKGQEVEVVYP